AFAPARFGFSTQVEQLSASSRSRVRHLHHNLPCQAGEIFGKLMGIEVWIRERALLPTASFSRSDLQSHNNQSGERKVCFMKTKTLFTRNSINRAPLQRPFLLIACAGVLLALSPKTQGQLSPTPDGGYAKMTIVPRAMLPFTAENSDDPGLVTIFSSLASKYPKGVYWCCEGYNVMGPNSGAGEQWMAAAFTPDVDRTVTKIEVGAGWSDGTKGIVISLNDDNNGIPGNALQTWIVRDL